jgi:hypothetical protein
LPPQQNTPDLDVPGPAKVVSYPPDGQIYREVGSIRIQAPPYTHITGLNLRCSLMNCPALIASDGNSVTAEVKSILWSFVYPVDVEVVADKNAPLSGGYFSGVFTLNGVSQALTVHVTPGVQGGLAANLKNTGHSGVRVMHIQRGSKTAASGLRRGDVITSFNGLQTPTVNDLDDAIRAKRAGATFPATVRRHGATVSLQLTLENAI